MKLITITLLASLAIAAAGCEAPAEENYSLEDGWTATQASVQQLVESKLGAESDDGLPRVGYVIDQGRGRFAVEYNADELVFGEDEVLRAQRPIFNQFFQDRSARALQLLPQTTLVSVGGQRDRGTLLKIKCDRSANRQIDWQVIDEDGMKALCEYQLNVAE